MTFYKFIFSCYYIMEIAIAGSLLAAGYFINNQQKNNPSNERFITSPKETSAKHLLLTKPQKPRGPKQYLCRGTHITNKNDCPYPSDKDTQCQDNVSKNKVVLLSGEVINSDKFKHNNMKPYFGSKLTQNVDSAVAQSLLSRHTGSSKCYTPKRSQRPLFRPHKHVGKNTNEHFRDSGVNMENRYAAACSRNKKCELPFKQIRVGQGLNQGYTSKPTGGFHQSNTRDYVMPKNVDELRVCTNPKKTYEGRVLPPKQISKREHQSEMFKHRPDTYYKNDPDRYFKTTGAYTKPTGRPIFDIKTTQRATTCKEQIGSVAPNTLNAPPSTRPLVAQSTRNQFLSDPIRNVRTVLTDLIDKNMGDYGKSKISLPANERDVTGTRSHLSNLVSIVKALIAPLEDKPKQTRKENFVGAVRSVGNLGMQIPSKMTVYDPNDIAKTTIKETLIHDAQLNNLNGPTKLTVYDPNDIAKITTRNTLQNVDTHLNLSGNNKRTVYDPNDKARTTLKETIVGKNQTGIVSGNSQTDGYKIANVIAPTTSKETTTENSNYSGNPDLNYVGGRGYLTNKIDAPNTNRQFTSDNEYTGVAGDNVSAQMSQENMCNALLNVNKEQIAKGRKPTDNNVKLMSGGDSVNINIRKNDCDRTNKRGATGLKGPTVITSKDICSVTDLRHDKYEDERLDPLLLDSLKDNPYAKRVFNLEL